MRFVPLLASCACLFGQIPETWFTEPILREHVRKSQMYAFVNANIPELPRFKTRAEWERYRPEIRRQLLRLLGIDDVLISHKLRFIQTGGWLDRDGYKVEKINFESFPGMWVPAAVWVPDDLQGKAPAAVSISGHSYCDSKGADYVQARAYNLVKRGFIVISYDYFGTFERARIDPCPPGAGGIDHRDSRFSFTDRTPTGIEALDAIRAVDYLCSRHDVDVSRILFTGESGGGNSTYWATALDDRIAASVPVSAAGAFEQWIKTDTNYDWHQRPPGIRAVADIGTLFALAAPRPLLVVNGNPELEEFALTDAVRSVDYAREVYRLYGKEGAIRFHLSNTGHGYQPDKRVQLYGWLNKWFFAGKMAHGEKDLPYQAEPKENFKAGLREGSLSIPALAELWVSQTARGNAIPLSAEAARTWQRNARADLEPLLGRRDPKAMPGVIYRHDYRREANGYVAERLIFEMERDLHVPAVFARKASAKRVPALIVLGKRNPAGRDWIERGDAVLALDPRGTGEVEWGGTRTSNWANLVGRPPVAQWSEDVSKAVTYLLGRPDVSEVSVTGDGVFGKAALYAAGLDERIQSASVLLDAASYRQEATARLAHAYADVPRILSWGDTAQLAALVAPRKLEIRGAGAPVSANEERNAYFLPAPRLGIGETRTAPDVLAREFEWAARFYKLLGAETAFAAHGAPR